MVDLTREQPLKVEDVAALFGVCRRTVENWFDRGLERVQIGRSVYTSLEAIQRFGKHSEMKPQLDSNGSVSAERKNAIKAAKKRFRI